MAPYVLVEGDHKGHRLAYVAHVISELTRDDLPVVLVTSPSAMASREAQVHLGSLGVQDRTLLVSPWTTWQWIRVVRRQRPRRVIIPDSDRKLPAAILLRLSTTSHLSLLVMRASHSAQDSLTSSVKHLFKRCLIGALRHLPRTRVFELASSTAAPTSTALPDPVTLHPVSFDRQAARAALGLDDSVTWFGVLGRLSARKNIDLLCAALQQVASPTRIGLLLAGTADSADFDAHLTSLLPGLIRSGVPVHWMNRVLSDEELDTAVVACDCVVLAHSNEGPSGILGKALAADTRALCAGATALADDAARRPDAVTWVPLRAQDLAQAMASIASTEPSLIPVTMPTPRSFARALAGLG